MKKARILIAMATFLGIAVSCDPKQEAPKPVEIKVQLTFNGAAFDTEGITVTLADVTGAATYEQTTDASGAAYYTVPLGSYTASATYKTSVDGVRIAYSGSNTGIAVSAPAEFKLELLKVESQQLIIKEVYSGGCPKDDGSSSYSDDAYFIIYNNSDVEADASNLVFTFAAPYNGNGTNKYYGTDEKLLYENDTWLPAYGAIWWFTSPVTIPAYSQIVVVLFGAIDHTQTVSASVDLSKSDYYWMSNYEMPSYTNKKYAGGDNIPTSHYLTGAVISPGNAWAFSNQSPAFYIANMPKAEAKALCEDTGSFDHTLGTSAAFATVKFPQANVVDAVEIWSAQNLDKSNVRFPASINHNAVALTNKMGYSIYRNVDKEATVALEENAGKLVFGYADGTIDVEGTTDPSGIDAEASIARGAHIIYSDTNDSAKDFHQRKTVSLKK